MSEVSMTELSKELRHAITALETSGDIQEVGVVVRVGDGVAWVHGLRKAGYSEVLEIETEDGVVEAFALNLLEDEIGAVLLGEDAAVKAGQSVKLKGTILDVPVGPELLGRVVDPLGRPLDGGSAIKTKQRGIVEREAPIHASNVAIFNSETGKADRVGFQVKEDGTKVRIYKSTQTQIDA